MQRRLSRAADKPRREEPQASACAGPRGLKSAALQALLSARRNEARRSAADGFSLVELLTVVAIIVLLIGILVPAVSKVRQTARRTATESLIRNTLSIGLDTFRADQQVGGAYSPSASDFKVSRRLTYMVVDPRSESGGGTNPMPGMEISGAGLLVWALAGADLLGTAGFRILRNDSRSWAQDTGLAYELDNDTRQPLRPRVAPFIDLTKVEVTRWNENARNGGSYEIPAEIEAREALGTPPRNMPVRKYPMFLDSFGGPILFWRADPAGLLIADNSPSDVDPEDRGTYHFMDNGALLDEDVSGQQEALVLQASNKVHRLFWDESADLIDPNERQGGFAGYIRNNDITAKVTTQRPESFLLISAGADGIYGTADDVANFEHNGAELSAP